MVQVINSKIYYPIIFSFKLQTIIFTSSFFSGEARFLKYSISAKVQFVN